MLSRWGSWNLGDLFLQGWQFYPVGTLEILEISFSRADNFSQTWTLHFCCSVTQSCLTLCDPMDYITPGFPVLHISWSLLKFMSIESVIPSNHLILCHLLLLLPSIFSKSGSFLMSQLLPSSSQNIGASASASVLPMNIQGWFPLGLIGLIS